MTAQGTIVETCESTNDLARKLGEQGAQHGTWISARNQEKGRGRMGRTWQSLPGNLFLSMVARGLPQNLWSWVPLSTAVGVAQAILGKRPDAPIQIKWPNDIWISGAKAGGILCEGVSPGVSPFIVIGIGLNCSQAPQGLDQAASSISVPVDELRPEIARHVLGSLAMLSGQGPQSVEQAYSRLALFRPGDRVEWAPDGVSKIKGVIEGLGPSGELRVRDAQGVVQGLFAEIVEFQNKTPSESSNSTRSG